MFAQVKLSKLKQLPIRTIDFTVAFDAERHDRMVALVERMLGLQKRWADAKISQDKVVLVRQIAALDKAIDALVYELYALTEEEAQIVENATSRKVATDEGASVGEAEVDAETLVPA